MLRKLVPTLLSLLLATSVSAAINFDDASSQYLSGASPITVYPFTVCAWFRSDDATASDQSIGSFADGATNTRHWSFRVDNNAPQPARFTTRESATTEDLDTSTGFTQDVWHYACYVGTSATSRTVYLDAAGSNSSATSITPGSIDNIGIGARPGSTVQNFFSGDIAEFAVWDAALSGSQITELYNSGNGLDATCVGSPIRYWPLADASDLTDQVNSQTLTANNTPTNATHPFSPIPGCSLGSPFIWLQLVK